ncbi:MAG: hypothetical protein GX487_08595 [Acetomicrobium flavidum]|uniref:hypothetical protein n=1 Tax=Acetomicrobium flavidum TaxID=49896 RepID=UPI001697516B|nr:hypothetical protein [Acetomicrobium flavidum]
MEQVVKLPQPNDWRNSLELSLFEEKAEGIAPGFILFYRRKKRREEGYTPSSRYLSYPAKGSYISPFL